MSKTVYAIVGVLALLLAIAAVTIPSILKKESRQVADAGYFVKDVSIWTPLAWIQSNIEKFTDSLKKLEDIQVEVEALRLENAELATQNIRLQGLTEENNRLREMLEFKKASDFKLLACRVIERNPSNWWNTIIINKGYMDSPHLEEDQPVVSPRGIVGKTGKVAAYTTKVVLLVDENCKISGVTETSRARGIIIGNTHFNGGTPSCRITFVSRDSAFVVGERVFTTGLGGTFPPNLLIGTISESPPLTVEKNFGLFREGKLQPMVDLDNLEELFIVLGTK
ncbi:MAG: rod shape-determining protein MreC [Verrucomicrobiota bacterium]